MKTFSDSRRVSQIDSKYFYEMCLLIGVTEEKQNTLYQALDMKYFRLTVQKFNKE